MKNMLILGFFLPFIPMVLVSGFISYQFYRAHPASHRAQSELTPADQSSLNRALGRASAAVLVAGGLIAANAYSLARKTVRNIRLADEKKERMAEQMHQTGKMAAIGELAAGVAHEINNPVAIMVEEAGWIADLLQDDALEGHPERGEVARAARQIQTQGKRCQQITHKLLSFARETDFDLAEIRLPTLVDDVVQIALKRAQHSGVRISTHIQEDLPTVTLPLGELQQVLINLINNALDAMEVCGGTLTIAVAADGDVLQIAVSDTGQGISKADLQLIFDPFFTTKPVGKGTGLGLSICYGIVNRIGGDLTVRSTLGQGTTFEISIPLQGIAVGGPDRLSTADGGGTQPRDSHDA
jgi:two-component system NtrC family sensor kinase